MKAYLINLDRRPDRLTFFKDQAAARGFSFERIVAVDGCDPALQERADSLGPGFSCEKLGPFELACFESHRKAWRTFLESGDPFGLIMEDDLVLAEDFAELLDTRWIPEDADLVRLETFRTFTYFDLRPVAKVGRRRLHRMRSTMLGGGAYIISRDKATALLTATEDAVDPLDHVLFDSGSSLFHDLVIYQMIPAPAIQGRKLKQSNKSDWAQSSLLSHRLKMRGEGSSLKGLERFRLWRIVKHRLWRLQARLKGDLYTVVRFR